MSDTVIKVENLGKQYHLGQVGTGTITHDLNRWWHRLRGKEDPYLKIGETNDRTKKGKSDLIWALRDINFDVKQGEVLGIIGKNGAGKSTLLKILSRVTSPTVGEIKVKGRIASLLEVGTGFHPELTGRENIFLNGAIMGMSKQEISSKFDEIVDFSGVERYIDTPVKRYSSGMYVRLAFAVAAHLEPEILIVDEVLAVGDAEFQKKCMGKMKDVSGAGRAVLFVSHNMPAVKNLCTKGLLIEKGTVRMCSYINHVVSTYLTDEQLNNVWKIDTVDLVQSQKEKYKVKSICVKNINGGIISEFNISSSYFVEIKFEILKENTSIGFSLVFSDNQGTCIFGSLNNTEPNFYGKKLSKGKYVATCTVDGNLFNNIELMLSLIVFGSQWTDSYVIENALKIKGLDDGFLKGDYYGEYGGFFRPKLKWLTIKED